MRIAVRVTGVANPQTPLNVVLATLVRVPPRKPTWLLPHKKPLPRYSMRLSYPHEPRRKPKTTRERRLKIPQSYTVTVTAITVCSRNPIT